MADPPRESKSLPAVTKSRVRSEQRVSTSRVLRGSSGSYRTGARSRQGERSSNRSGPSEVTKGTSDEARPIKLPRHLKKYTRNKPTTNPRIRCFLTELLGGHVNINLVGRTQYTELAARISPLSINPVITNLGFSR